MKRWVLRPALNDERVEQCLRSHSGSTKRKSCGIDRWYPRNWLFCIEILLQTLVKKSWTTSERQDTCTNTNINLMIKDNWLIDSFIQWRRITPANRTGPSQGFSLVQTLHIKSTRFVAWCGKIPPLPPPPLSARLYDSLGRYSLKIATLSVTLTMRTAITNCRTTLWLLMMHHYTKFGCKKGQKFRRYGINSNVLRISAHTVTVTLRI